MRSLRINPEVSASMQCRNIHYQQVLARQLEENKTNNNNIKDHSPPPAPGGTAEKHLSYR